MALIVAQGCLLVSRTWLTDYISRIEALAGRHLISQVRPRSNSTFMNYQQSFKKKWYINFEPYPARGAPMAEFLKHIGSHGPHYALGG